MALKACSCVSLVFLVALAPALHSQVAPAVEPSEGVPTQSSTLHPQSQNKDLGPDLPLHSVPKETVSVRFVARIIYFTLIGKFCSCWRAGTALTLLACKLQPEVAEQVVKNRLVRIREKLGCVTTVEAVVRCVRAGLLA